MKQLLLKGRSILLLNLILVFYSCTNAAKEIEKPSTQVVAKERSNDIDYPKIIQDKGLEMLYDEAKWTLYLYTFMDTASVVENERFRKMDQPLGTYELRFDSLISNNGKYLCTFEFYLNGVKLRDSISKDVFSTFIPNVIIGDETEKCAAYLNNNSYARTSKTCVEHISNKDVNYQEYFKKKYGVSADRHIKLYEKLFVPLGPSRLKYLKDNQSVLNNWFVSQARKRGVLN